MNIAIVCTCPMFLLFAQNIDHYINGLVLEHLCPISTLISTASYETIKWTLEFDHMNFQASEVSDDEIEEW